MGSGTGNKHRLSIQLLQVELHRCKLLSLLSVAVIFFVYSAGWYNVDRFITGAEHSIPFNTNTTTAATSTATPPPSIIDTVTRQPPEWLNIVDGAVMMWSSLVSALSVALCFLVSRALYKHYERFYKQMGLVLDKLFAEESADRPVSREGEPNSDDRPAEVGFCRWADWLLKTLP